MSALPHEPISPGIVPDPFGRLLVNDHLRISARPDLATLAGLLDAAGLTGRGGAGFPTGRKLATVASQRRRPGLVVNAMEGEPLARKDEVLLNVAPGLVIDGAEILARALGAKRLVAGVGAQIPTGAFRVALAERQSRLEVQVLPDTFVGGQETALVNSLNGRAGVPTDPASPVWQRGLDGRPTMVVNAETAAQVALVVAHGVDWFRSLGAETDPGTFLLSVSGSSDQVIATGVTEAPRGTRLREVLSRFGLNADLVGGVLVGGYHGAWLPASALDIPLERDVLAPWGASTGAGVLHVLDRRHCPVEVTARITSYLAGQSARQCGPCVNGLPALSATVNLLATAPRSRMQSVHLESEVERLNALVEGRGACAHPDGTVRLVRSMLRTFRTHVNSHTEGRCHS